MNNQDVNAGGDVVIGEATADEHRDGLTIIRTGMGEPAGEIRFEIPGLTEPVLRFAANGDIFVRGRLVETDLEVVAAFKNWLSRAQALSPWRDVKPERK